MIRMCILGYFVVGFHGENLWVRLQPLYSWLRVGTKNNNLNSVSELPCCLQVRVKMFVCDPIINITTFSQSTSYVFDSLRNVHSKVTRNRVFRREPERILKRSKESQKRKGKSRDEKLHGLRRALLHLCNLEAPPPLPTLSVPLLRFSTSF